MIYLRLPVGKAVSFSELPALRRSDVRDEGKSCVNGTGIFLNQQFG